MDIRDALTYASISYTVDSRAKYRKVPETGSALVSVFVIGDETDTALSKALALDECPLLFLAATNRVLVLRSGNSGSIAIEAVDTPTISQELVLAEIGKASYEICRVPFGLYETFRVSSRKKVKPDPVAIIEPEAEPDLVDASPSESVVEEVDTSEIIE